ncbi:MAG: glycoside hydrolase family 2 [Bacteroidales bacterium]|nr:glycoside hydrolase family 2 [Bacteroidales bacterium]
MKNSNQTLVILTSVILFTTPLIAQETEYMYLSGTGNDNTTEWDFYCTQGNKAGRWTKIPVPSCWELEGFGTYNYGLDKDTVRGKETGMYKYTFKVPSNWQNKIICLVFEGSMTDTEVKINGQPAGPRHQGAFYRFTYDITDLLKVGKTNQLEVSVAKHSSNESINKAERHADYWIFGGIFRPVYLEATPKEYIEGLELNARADGEFTANVKLKGSVNSGKVTAQIYTLDGQKTGDAFEKAVKAGDTKIQLATKVSNPKLWSPEFPNLYTVQFTLTTSSGSHVVNERFGFRTVELRERDGIYVNGAKVKFKGICRHSFWPSSGRTVSKELSIKDVELMKEMNMNAVRNSHYPPDKHFLDVCDSLGLFVLDELAGWHDAYDTEVGTKLVHEMLASNMNHPSIVMWVNGNEGGHNPDLLPLYEKLDIQKRPVIQAWETFKGTNTEHYINYDYGAGTCFHGHEVVFPTEFLHGLYDGGHGAGLDDYWELMWHLPLSAGGFLWDLSDEGVVRKDKNGIIDTDGNHGADGILGPYREKEGSFYTVKEVWSPVYFEPKEITPAFDGRLKIENRYHYTNMNQCTFKWKLTKYSGPGPDRKETNKTGGIPTPSIEPGDWGYLNLTLPEDWKNFDVLYVTALDAFDHILFTWSWPVSLPGDVAGQVVIKNGEGKIQTEEKDSLLIVSVNEITITFNKNNGLLERAKNSNGIIPLGNGPVLCDGKADFQKMNYRMDGDSLLIENEYGKESNFKYVQWKIFPSGWVQLDVAYRPQEYLSDFMGINFSFPESEVKAVQWFGDGPYRVWKNRMKGNSLGVWDKDYNNTITGVKDFVYPEFKGYHSRMYWMKLMTNGQPLTVVSNDEDIFMRLFTPETPEQSFNTAPPFPTGDLSFLQAIPPIGTKSQIPDNMGPSGRKNMYFDYWKARAKSMRLFFDFSGS